MLFGAFILSVLAAAILIGALASKASDSSGGGADPAAPSPDQGTPAAIADTATAPDAHDTAPTQEEIPTPGSGAAVCDDPKVQSVAEAIAFAEGYYAGDTRPWRNNNPGDFLGDGDAGTDGRYAIYSTAEAGWQRLCHQLALIRDSKSHVYNLAMTISQMARRWTTTEQVSWAQNVANHLGVSVDRTLGELLT